jgi:hypothetical protein
LQYEKGKRGVEKIILPGEIDFYDKNVKLK